MSYLDNWWMQEGLAAPVPLFGACVKTHELITIDAPKCTETGAPTTITTLEADRATSTTSAEEQAVEDTVADDLPVATASSVAGRRRRIRGRRGRRAASSQEAPGDSDGIAESSSSIVYLAPRCYCLLSRLPHFDMLFATLYGLLRSERLHSIKDEVVCHCDELLTSKLMHPLITA